MICCDRSFVWQHVDCVGLDRASLPEDTCVSSVSRAGWTGGERGRCSCAANRSCSPTRTTRPERRSRRCPADRQPLKKSAARPPTGQRTVAERRRRRQPQTQAELQRQQPNITQPTLPSAERKRLPVKKQRRMSRNSLSRSSAAAAGAAEDDDEPSEAPARKLRCWIDEYEEAVSNHYSAELRSRLAGMRTGAVPPPPAGPERCVVATVDKAARGLVAALPIVANTTLLEFRGRCMLLDEYRQQYPLQSKRYQPHVLLYRFPRDALHVCVDARHYGNAARFVRRSCRPNAVIRHVVDRGALRLHLVAMAPVSRQAEITIAHDQGEARQLVCACGRVEGCPVAAQHNNNGAINNNDKTAATPARRRRRSSVRPPSPTPSAPSDDNDSSEEGAAPPPVPTPPPAAVHHSTPRKKSPRRGLLFQLAGSP